MCNLKFTGERVVPEQMDANDNTYLEHLARYQFALEHKEGENVLDAACGSGYGTQMLGAVGIDVSQEAVDYAKEKYGVEVFLCDLETDFLSLKKERQDSIWDTVVSFETIEHLQDPSHFLESVAKNSKRFIFSIPLNNPSKFHKQVYTLDQAQKLIYKFFNKVEWFEQNKAEIRKLQSKNPGFVVGIASNVEQPTADLVLVSHNSKNDLEKFLPSLKEKTKNYTLTIVDNSDQQETIDYLDELAVHQKIVENKGYGAACNAGAKEGHSDFVVFMNCDLEASEGWLDELLKPFNDEKVVIAGARLFSPDGKEYPTPAKDFAIGAVFAVRRSFFDEIGGFDEKFFLFFEETDMCRKATKLGYKVRRSEAKMVHFNPHFLPQIEANPFLKKCWDESKEYYQTKHGDFQPEKYLNKKLLIGMPSASGTISAYVVDGLFKLTRPCPTSLLIVERQGVDVARNYLFEMAIRLGVDYLFMADDDGVLPDDTLIKLVQDDKDIVAAPMLTRNARDNGKHSLCCFEKFDFYIGDGRTINKYRSIQGFDNSKGYLHEVDGVGAACMLIKKEVIQALFVKHDGRPFEFLHEVHETKEHGVTVRNISEDMCFSERAKEEGFQIWIDTRIRPVHLGKPKFVRFEQEGEDLPALNEPMKGCITLSENLKSEKNN